MCEKQQKIEQLERELAESHRRENESHQREAESHQREAELFRTLAEGRNFESQTKWRPWQVAMIPTFVALLALVAAIAK